MTTEIWKPIPGFPGYDASSEGRIRSHRGLRAGAGPRIRRLCLNPVSRYPQLGMSFGKRRATATVHSLVMLAFVGPPPPGQEVRHLDGDPTNCALTNLAYGTHRENEADKFLHGSHNMASRTHCKHGHEYTPENTAIWHNNGSAYRQCVTCANERRSRGKAKREAAA